MDGHHDRTRLTGRPVPPPDLRWSTSHRSGAVQVARISPPPARSAEGREVADDARTVYEANRAYEMETQEFRKQERDDATDASARLVLLDRHPRRRRGSLMSKPRLLAAAVLTVGLAVAGFASDDEPEASSRRPAADESSATSGSVPSSPSGAWWQRYRRREGRSPTSAREAQRSACFQGWSSPASARSLSRHWRSSSSSTGTSAVTAPTTRARTEQ